MTRLPCGCDDPALWCAEARRLHAAVVEAYPGPAERDRHDEAAYARYEAASDRWWRHIRGREEQT